MNQLNKFDNPNNLVHVKLCTGNTARKRTKLETKRQKATRYTCKGLPLYPRCGHKGKAFQPYQCTFQLSMKDIKEFHDAFYRNKEKTTQDLFILRHCGSKTPKRRRQRKDNGNKKKLLTVQYKVKRSDGLDVRVCRDAFLNILGIKEDRILNVVKRFFQKSILPKENRGGNRVGNKNDNKKQAIKEFMESLKCTESHYCRSKTFNRFYLPAELSIVRLWRIYNETVKNDEPLKVKESFFRDYVNKNFNIGFGTPKTDLCSTCLQYKTVIKKTQNDTNKQNLIAQQRLHKIRAGCFYQLLQEERQDLATFSFDCQKNLALPKLPDQSAYFSMQIHFYHLAIVCGSSKAKLNQENVRSYVWTEIDHQRSSNEISSALHHALSQFNFTDQIKVVRLVCDGCGAQNKNSTVIGMLVYWLQCEAPSQIRNVELIFPVVGHSYIPPDRVFGQIERIYKKQTEFVHPGEYVNIINKFATVFKIGSEVKIRDWRNEAQKVFKQQGYWHFNFQPSKRIMFTKVGTNVLVNGESFYKNSLCTPKSLCKRGKKVASICPKQLDVGVPIKKDKKASIKKLLETHYGKEWENEEKLVFFKEVFQNHLEEEQNNNYREHHQCEEENTEFGIYVIIIIF